MTSMLETPRREPLAIHTARLLQARAVPISPRTASALWATTVVGCLAAWFVSYALGLGALQEHHAQHVLFAKFRQQLAQQVAPPRLLPSGAVAPLHAGEPVALLSASRLHLHNAVVVQGTRAAELRNGPGHLPGTVLPGENGTAWILGRGATFGGPFGTLDALRAGDHLTVTTQQGRFTYVVNDVRSGGDPIPSTSSDARLTLATSVGSGWRSGWAPTHVVYVDATLQGTPLPVTEVPQTVSRADAVGRNDPAALVPLFLWLLALVVAAGALLWARVRWGGWQAWLVGAPVVVAGVWGASDAAIQLLPNVF